MVDFARDRVPTFRFGPQLATSLDRLSRSLGARQPAKEPVAVEIRDVPPGRLIEIMGQVDRAQAGQRAAVEAEVARESNESDRAYVGPGAAPQIDPVQPTICTVKQVDLRIIAAALHQPNLSREMQLALADKVLMLAGVA